MVKLQILIPTLPERKESFDSLVAVLRNQTIAAGYEWEKDVHYLFDDTGKGLMSIGEKRNLLLDWAIADYVAFFDDDDRPSPYYIKHVMEGISKGVDACSLRGVITWDGERPEIFEHSIKYSEWKTNSTGDIKYERNTNHLNVIKRSIAQQFRFPETSFGEDHDFSKQLHASGLIKTEHYIDEIIYNYQYKSNK